MKRTAFCLAAILAAGMPALAQGPDYSKVEEVSTDLGKGVYAITGAGGNTTIAVGAGGVIVVDTQFAPVYDKLKAKIASLSGGKPILYVINTHYHGDHTGGNADFHAKDKATILAHPQVAERMRHPAPRPDGSPGAALPTDAIPGQTYSGNGMTLAAGGASVQLIHPAPAHTDGDTIVIFLAANVIATGDIVGMASYPNIDVAAGGGIDGMIAGTNFILSKSDASTKIVPGHGAVTDRAGLTQYRDMLVEARARIAKAKAGGMSEDQLAKANLLADLDKRWAAPGNPLAVRFPINVYRSLP
jgi:glyoxylase-like metal-dependent hydrolase (beta-lactamase superfamily II)